MIMAQLLLSELDQITGDRTVDYERFSLTLSGVTVSIKAVSKSVTKTIHG